MTDEPVSSLEACIARLEGLCEQIDRRLGALEARFDSGFADLRTEIRASRLQTDAKLVGLDSKIEGLGAKVDELEAKIDNRFNIVTFLYFFIAALQLAAALGFFDRSTP